MDIDTLLQAHLTHYTIFYVPSTEEIIVQDRMQVDDEAKIKDEFYAKIVIDPETIEQDVKALCKPPTRFGGDIPLYRSCKKMKFNTRKVTF